MLEAWVTQCLELSHRPAEFYSGSCKILRGVQLVFPFECDLTMADAGYTSAKMKQLERNYLHQGSIDAAVELWDKYRKKPKYRSVSFTCYNHFVKDHKGPIGSVMGPCLQSVVITMLPRKQAEIHVLYRTTEVFKKFPADLVFLSKILQQFDFTGLTVQAIKCFFTNLTVHPAYYVTLIPHLTSPIRELERLRIADRAFHQKVVRWTSCYMLEEHQHVIAKFAQAQRVKMYADKIVDRDDIKEYLRFHHDKIAVLDEGENE